MPGWSVGDPGAAAAVEGAPGLSVGAIPDSIADGGTVGDLTVRVASVRGAGHRYDGTPRQDDVMLGVAGPSDAWLVVAVADGVSAGARSHLAARAAVRFGVRHLQELLAAAADPAAVDWDGVIGATAGFVLAQARRELDDGTLDARAAARQMATTIAFAVIPTVPDDADGSRRVVVVPLGDTSVWVVGPAGWRSVTARKNEGEAIAGSATLALPLLPSGRVDPLTARLGAGEALFVVTDGVGDPLGDGAGEVGATLARWWSAPPDRYTFAAQVDFGRRSHTDDRTAVGVWCPTGDEPGSVAGAADETDDAAPVPGAD